jgi:hypothetical protein
VLGYRVLVNEPNSNAVPQKVVYDGSAISNVFQVKVTGLQSQKNYWFSHQARNRAGWSALRTPYLKIVAGPLPAPPPEAPEIISTSQTEIKFRWKASPDVSAAALLVSYKIYSGDTVVGTVQPGVLEHTLSGSVTAGSSYLISIQSVSEIGEGETRSLATLMWAVETPAAPSLQVTATSRDSCSVQWSAVAPPANSLL